MNKTVGIPKHIPFPSAHHKAGTARSGESLPPCGQQRAAQPHSAATDAEQIDRTNRGMELRATLRTLHISG